MGYYIQGYICRYDEIDEGGDILTPAILGRNGLFSGQDVKMLYQHDITRPIGIWHSFYSDDYGLYATGEICTDFPDGVYTASLAHNQIIDGFSIGFIPKKYFIRSDGVRVIQEIVLKEVSLVTFPMQNNARLQLISY